MKKRAPAGVEAPIRQGGEPRGAEGWSSKGAQIGAAMGESVASARAAPIFPTPHHAQSHESVNTYGLTMAAEDAVASASGAKTTAAPNGQWHTPLEHQRAISHDLRNILDSADIPILVIGQDLTICFFTPAMRRVFCIVPTDIGRPIADLRPRSTETTLAEDALLVLQTGHSIERDIELPDDMRYSRRMMPYRPGTERIEGVVITFIDITRHVLRARALDAAKQIAETENAAKSRALAAASHDLRQPLQGLVLTQGLLAAKVKEAEGQRLAAMLAPPLAAMTVMINGLLDIDHLDADAMRHHSTQESPGGPAFQTNKDSSRQPIAAPEFQSQAAALASPDGDQQRVQKTASILVIDNDPDLGGLLESLLTAQGYAVACVADAVAAIEIVDRGRIRPHLILVDFPLSGPSNGIQIALKLRERLHRRIPVVILRGNAPADVWRDPPDDRWVYLPKPVASGPLLDAIRCQLRAMPHPAFPPWNPPDGPDEAAPPLIHIIDDDETIQQTLRDMLEDHGYVVEIHATCEIFLAAYRPGRCGCLLVDAYLPGIQGLELLEYLKRHTPALPSIMITGDSDVRMVVQALQAGASDFIEKPFVAADLLASIARALEQASESGKKSSWQKDALHHMAQLTTRQRQIMDMVLAGHPSKNIAADLGISQRTVENHRASIMKRTGSRSLPALARLAVAAASGA